MGLTLPDCFNLSSAVFVEALSAKQTFQVFLTNNGSLSDVFIILQLFPIFCTFVILSAKNLEFYPNETSQNPFFI